MKGKGRERKRRVWTPAEFRAEIGRKNVKQRALARKLGIDPSRLSAMLNEWVPFPPDVADQLAALLADDNPGAAAS